MRFHSSLPFRHISFLLKVGRLHVLTLVGGTCWLLTGCGMGTTTNTPGAGPGNANTMKGKVHGGQQPVVGATIQLYAAGTNAYGSGAAPLLSGPVFTDANGTFIISNDYNCPAGDAQVYIAATGGNPGLAPGTNNGALALMAALGSCNNLKANAASTFISINEVTTIASAFALAPFSAVNPSGPGIVVGTSGGNGTGLAHAMSTVNNLVDVSTGFARSITPAYASNPVPALNSSVVPQARINTLASILSSCVNTAGASGTGNLCSQLFTSATPPGGAAPVDTLQAALDIALNPGKNVSSLFGLSQTNPPFQPTLPAAPNDWLLAIGYTGAGLGLPPGDMVGQLQNHHLAIDGSSNLWVTAQGLASGGSVPAGSNIIAQFDYLGTPLTSATTQPTPTTVNFGGYNTGPSLGTAGDMIAFDQAGQAWVTAYQASGLDAYLAGPMPALTAPIIPDVQSFGSLAIDAIGNVWGSGMNNGGTGEILEYDGSGNLISPSTGYTGGGMYGPNYYANPAYLTFDSTANNLWATDNSRYGDFYLISDSTGQLTYDYFQTGGVVTPLVAGASGNIFACPTGISSIMVFNVSSITGPTQTYPSTTGRGCGGQMVADGLGNLWVLSGTGLDEYSSSGVLLSPASAYTATSSSEADTFQNLSVDMAIDSAGNLWVLNNSTGVDPSIPARSVLFELVGAASPVLTPLSQALANGQTATRP